MAQGASGPSSAMPPQAGGGPTSPAWWWAMNASTPMSCHKQTMRLNIREILENNNGLQSHHKEKSQETKNGAISNSIHTLEN
eukprot:CAMPEP_0113683872 /NCGR_PEP_ID=MMETSP0038_2-20120614/13611_1 /TAXON_ID=2898 /ORGANISM="Cryptomonas paramecium" /LENGTH=81 /DNA_ID=CAMNT_0000603403 /DNA_START=188 /DNA_END=430 /DNA_ORIENTATION=- /assembly_acc=CAM_ASM_000170